MKRLFLIFCLLCTSAFAIVGNFNSDCRVDFKDFALLSANWQSSGTGDLDSSGMVDFNDLAIFVTHWLESELATADPNVATTPDPANHATGVLITKTLTWSMVNQGCETTAADVWFGEPNAMSKVVSDTYNSSYSPTLEKGHGYQWRIDTKNSHGTTTGAVWDFNVVDQNVPVASNGSASAYTYIVKPITLTATDDNYPNPPAKLKYVITELPSDANAYLQDPVSGGQSRIDPCNLPYRLSSWGKVVWFATTTVGTSHFHFKAYDGEFYSDEKQVDVNTIANPKDCLSFDGQGWVTIPDTSDRFDLVSGKMICFFIKTRAPYLGILKKHETGKAGYEIGLIGGRITARIYDANNTVVAQIQSNRRYDNGEWVNAGICYRGSTYNKLELFTGYGTLSSSNWYESAETLSADGGGGDVNVPVGTYSNDCNTIVGKNSDGFYKWEMDNIRTYTSQTTNMFRSLNTVQERSIAGNSELIAPGAAACRFFMDTIDTWNEEEGTGYAGSNNTDTQIWDDKSATHLIGTFNSSSHVRYYPFFWHWYDSAAMQHTGGGQ